jgi:hypothetical protein
VNNLARQRLIVCWTLWAAFMVCPFFYYKFLNSGHTNLGGDDSFLWLISLVPLSLSILLRWVVLGMRPWPMQAMLAIMVMGIALSEALCFFGLFLFPAHKQELFVLSFLGMGQFMPVYARRSV